MSQIFAHANDGKELERSVASAICIDESEDLAVQSDALDADINVLVKRFGLTTDSPMEAHMIAHFGDFTDLRDFHSTMQSIKDVEQSFETLPSAVRERFRNDPGEFIDFLSDPGNRDELARMGVLTPEAAGAILRPKEPAPQEGSKPPGDSGSQAE